MITDNRIKKEPFGLLADGTQVFAYTLSNPQGMTMKVINYGGIIVSLTAPDRNGKMEDVVLGFDTLAGYVNDTGFYGGIIGRYANRIANGKFTLDGYTYSLAKNNGNNHLHGGIKGFHKVFWNIEEYPSTEGPGLRLTYLSPDGEEGFPGNLRTEVTYVLTDKNELKICYSAVTDKKTIVNLTQHSYFNLTGDPRQDILSHLLMLNADQFLPVNSNHIPTGELRNVQSTPFDFTQPKTVGLHINETDEQLILGGGYDHCWVVREKGSSPQLAAVLTEPRSGRVLSVYTTEPGIQLYTGNFLDGSAIGKSNIAYAYRCGICLETQHFPDSPNHQHFPSVTLNPGETYRSQTVFAFATLP